MKYKKQTQNKRALVNVENTSVNRTPSNQKIQNQNVRKKVEKNLKLKINVMTTAKVH